MLNDRRLTTTMALTLAALTGLATASLPLAAYHR